MADRMHSLYRQVYRMLRGRILTGEYGAGEQIETEPQLAKQLKASLITIRQAEQMLVDDGLLVKQQGRGTFVATSLAGKLRILGVCGLQFAEGHRHHLGAYYSNLLTLSQEEAARRGIEFETAWLPTNLPASATAFSEKETLREFLGFLFVGCGVAHPMLTKVQKLKLSHVLISPFPAKHNAVFVDYKQAMELAAGIFASRSGRPVLAIGQEHMRATCVAAFAARGLKCLFAPMAFIGERSTPEVSGYNKMRELVAAGKDIGRLLLLDDTVARGATRALLEAGRARRAEELVVVGGRQEIIPLGLPTTYVVHDTWNEVHCAFEILDQQRRERGAPIKAVRSEFFVLREPNGQAT